MLAMQLDFRQPIRKLCCLSLSLSTSQKDTGTIFCNKTEVIHTQFFFVPQETPQI